MAKRPVFIPQRSVPYWTSIEIEFDWFPGFALSQRQKSIASLHQNAVAKGKVSNPIEISSRSTSNTGAALSAFNLEIEHPLHGTISLESAFQGSKVFERAGQIERAYQLLPREAKSLARETDFGDRLIGFRWNDEVWPLEPKSWFYDWLYINAVVHTRPHAIEDLRQFDAFTDIEFNPAKSFNCQARSCAIIASTGEDELLRFISEPKTLFIPPADNTENELVQSSLF